MDDSEKTRDKQARAREVFRLLTISLGDYREKGRLLRIVRDEQLFLEEGYPDFPACYRSFRLRKQKVSCLIRSSYLIDFFEKNTIQVPETEFMARAILEIDLPAACISKALSYRADIWINFLSHLADETNVEYSVSSFLQFYSELYLGKKEEKSTPDKLEGDEKGKTKLTFQDLVMLIEEMYSVLCSIVITSVEAKKIIAKFNPLLMKLQDIAENTK